ncbi:HAMP domain-containing protein [Phreatobacter aquaticus]|uniref:HAMP domain-containing protein n=1 Tax=Phreatobacter aquaticus TaxID=2570229 RepID=A0A4D7QRY2_9HYPH|nr:HAMP domain-containing methyl-accepting chemotaxis protein [Phreatobacter aquaticus]QCK88346.1 HAMP domain-containing protein [Phreatobacter aquaticus]
MSALGRVSISAKILGLVALLSAVAAAIGAIGYYAVGQLRSEVTVSARVSSRAFDAVVVNRGLAALSRAEYVMATDPSQITRQVALIEEDTKAIASRMATLREARVPEVVAAVNKADVALQKYLPLMQETVRIATGVTGTATPEQRARIAQSSLASSDAYMEARMALRELTLLQQKRSDDGYSAAYATAESMQNMILYVGIATVLFGLALGFVIGRVGIASPIRVLTACLRELAEGRFNVTVPGTDRRDEVGDIARAAETFKANGIETNQLRAEQEAAKARAEQEQKAMMQRMADDFDHAVGGIITHVSSASAQLKSAAQTLSSSAEEASVQSGAVAAASEEASANVQTVASATEELSASVREIGERVEQSARMASAAVANADSSAGMIKDLAEKAQKIGEIVELINSIASQTNLLALNATIEAARAGEAGKGFAVVAAEVKSLADQTSKATTDIANQINGIQAATNQSAEAITGIASSIREISAVAASISAAVEEQNAATQEIARNVQEASAGTGEVSTNIVGVSQTVTETGAAASQVLGSAETLAVQAASLSTEMSKFLATIRAA